MNALVARLNDKRDRLVAAARSLFHRKGFGETSLADIARESGVRLGNVYYYFKTKEDIAGAVIEAHSAYLAAIARQAEQMPDARQRVLSMLDSMACNCEEIAHSGCPMGSLCMEFGKRDTALRDDANRLLLRILSWIDRQLSEMGRSDGRALAIQAVATIQGASVLALAMRDPSILRQEVERLKALVDGM